MNIKVDGQVLKLIRSQDETIDLERMLPINDIITTFETEGYTMEDLKIDGNMNGWSVDFWYYFSHPTKARYCVSGSLWYGEFKIYKSEENKDD